MSRTKRKSAPPPSVAASRVNRVLAWVVVALIGSLIVGRLLVPAESAPEGDTLWIVQLWLAAGLLWAWTCYRYESYEVRVDAGDLAVWTIVAGHVISALVVVAEGGQKRAAIDCLWEWVGLGVSFFLVRQLLAGALDRRRMLALLTSAAITLAGLGVWQHYIWHRQMVQTYQDIRTELDTLTEAERLDPGIGATERRRQIDDLQLKLIRLGIPLEGAGRKHWEDRLVYSTEPIGLFALANTFAGLLIPWAVISAALAAGIARLPEGRWKAISPLLGCLAVCFSLELSKSRTAWVGVFAAIAVWGWLRLRRGLGRSRVWLTWGACAAVALGLLAFLAVRGGGLDSGVVSEAPKSLKYRMQFWTASWSVVQEQPVLGVGPGNFRQHYLRHKAPESSEEILDPHNFLLDLWASGGMIALAGCVLLAVTTVRGYRRTVQDDELPPADATPSSAISTSPKRGMRAALSSPLAVGALLSFPIVYVMTLALGFGLDNRLLVLAFVWLALFLVLHEGILRVNVPREAIAAGIVGVLVHLLGAGGIEMPVITQMLLILVAMVTSSDRVPGLVRLSRAPRLVFGFGMSMLVLFVACLLTATSPVLNWQTHAQNGDNALIGEMNDYQAEKLYLAAIDSDPMSPEPWERLAGLYMRQWRITSRGSEEQFQKVIDASRRACERNPHNANSYRLLGQWMLEKYQRTRNPRDAQAAADVLWKAVVRYPHEATARAELADALGKAGHAAEARQQAELAYGLDEINRREAHRDKYLRAGMVNSLRQIVDKPRPGDSAAPPEGGPR